MENFKLIIVIPLLLFPFFFFGQNLVRNHSFEAVGNLPILPTPNNGFEYEPTSGYRPFQKNLKYWKAASLATPDLRIIDKGSFRSCQSKYKDCNRPHSGNHMAGIMTSLKNSSTKTFREYIQIKLKSPLKPGIKTYVELWIQKDRQAKLVSNNIGFYFSRKKVFEEIENQIKVVPQVNHDTLINAEILEWVKIEGTFIPKRKHEYLTIGNFYNNENTKVETFKGFRGSDWIPPYAQYLIDDVRVWQEGPTGTPVQVPEVAEISLKKMEKNKAIVIENIFFDLNRATLKEASFASLNTLVISLQKNKNLKIEIRGHTDDRGSATHNLKLSTARAQAVFSFLIQKGIEREQIKFMGLGSNQPLTSNETEEGRAKNRRVEFLILE